MMNLRMIALFSIVLMTTFGKATAQTTSDLPPALRDVRFDQRLNEQVPLDLEFVDERGQPVKLSRYFGKRPVVLVLAYYECPMLCTQVLNGLVRGMLELPFTAGDEFEVLTVSFDPRDTPARAAAKKKTYVGRYGRKGADEGWHFLTGQEDAIHRLTEAVGFRYVYDQRSEQFAHASGIIVLTPAGKISRYFYDISYPARDLRLGLVEASQGKIGSPVEQIMLFCFHYDPEQGKYGPTIMTLVRAGSVVTVLGLGVMMILLYRSERRRPQTIAAQRLLEASIAKGEP